MGRHGMGELKGETGEGRHRATDITQQPDLGAMRSRVAELRVGRDAARAQRPSHGPPEVETPGSTFAPPRQARCQLPGQRADRRFHLLEVGGGGMHEVHIFDERATKRPGDSLPATVDHQPTPDLFFDLETELLDAGFASLRGAGGGRIRSSHRRSAPPGGALRGWPGPGGAESDTGSRCRPPVALAPSRRACRPPPGLPFELPPHPARRAPGTAGRAGRRDRNHHCPAHLGPPVTIPRAVNPRPVQRSGSRRGGWRSRRRMRCQRPAHGGGS